MNVVNRWHTEFEDYTNSEIRLLIDELIHDANEREIMYMVLIDGKTYEYIAEQVGMHPSHLGKVIRKNKRRLLAHINELNVLRKPTANRLVAKINDAV